MEEVKLKDYQRIGVQFLGRRKRAILADEMGLGKTLTASYVAFKHPELKNQDRILIACSKNAMMVWRDEIEKWFPERSKDVILVLGNKAKRMKLWGKPKGIFIATYETIRQDIGDMPLEWGHIIGDEAHKLRNRKTQLFATFKKLRSATIHFLTGTPASRGPQDLWTMLHLLKPKVFSSYWKFIGTFCIIDHGPFSRDIVGTKNEEQLQMILKDIMLLRKKKEVSPELPPKIRSFRAVELDAKTRKVYDNFNKDLVATLVDESDNLLISPIVISKITAMRQLLVCPKAIDVSLPLGAGIEYVAQEIEDNELRHTAIFTPFPNVFPFWREYLNSLQLRVYEVRGGMDIFEARARIQEFRERGGVLLASIKYAQAWSIEFCPTAYFIGYEWDPQLNYQAEDRLHRMTIKEPVYVNYLRFPNTYDDSQIAILDEKQMAVRPIYRSAKDYLTIFAPEKINEVRKVYKPTVYLSDDDVPF